MVTNTGMMNPYSKVTRLLIALMIVLVVSRASANDNAKPTNQCTGSDHDDSTCIISEQQPTSNKSSFPRWNPRGTRPCNIRQITWAQVLAEFGPSGLPPMYPDPLVILADGEGSNHKKHAAKKLKRNQLFQELSREDRILDSFPSNFNVTLSSSNSVSEHRRTIPFAQYLDELKGSVDLYPVDNDPSKATQNSSRKAALSNETWYLFGETYSPEWKDFLKNYELPLCEACISDSVALSFGIGNCGSGVQWHVHGPGFSEAVIGRKHWILYQDKPDFHKDQTSLNWMETNYMDMTVEDRPFECSLNPGDLIYFPNMWWHATINLDDYTAFVSTFTQEHLFV